MPASTLQVLGAEKALFRSLKTGALASETWRDIPKHCHPPIAPMAEGKDCEGVVRKTQYSIEG